MWLYSEQINGCKLAYNITLASKFESYYVQVAQSIVITIGYVCCRTEYIQPCFHNEALVQSVKTNDDWIYKRNVQ